MSSIRIVTDSTADIPEELRQSLKIEMVPLKVIFGEESFLDSVTLRPEQFYDKLSRAQALPKTSQPSPADFQQVYERLLIEDEEADIISIHISSALSGTIQAALLAKSMTSNPEAITVIDSKSASYGFGMIVVEAAKAALAGEEKAAIVDKITRYFETYQVYFVVDTLEYLQKGGRIGKAAALMGTLLQIKPLLAIDREGEITVIDKMRGKKRALNRIFALIANGFSDKPIRIAILHTNQDDEARQLAGTLKEQFNVVDAIAVPIGPVVGTHAGPGTIGVVIAPL